MILKEIRCERFEENEQITFVTDEEIIDGNIYLSPCSNAWFISLCTYENDYLYAKLTQGTAFVEFNDFVKKVVGYNCTGSWPEVKSIEDLKKVLTALLRLSMGNSPQTSAPTTNPIKVNRHKQVKLNFNL